MWYNDSSLAKKQSFECYKNLDTLKKIAKCLDNMYSDNFDFSFPGIKKDIERIEYKFNYLLDKKSEYGLYRMKNEISDVAKRIKHYLGKIEKVDNIVTTSGMVMNDVKKRVNKIENFINDPAFGLKEIRIGVRSAEKQIKRVDDAVNDPGFGLKSIKWQSQENHKKLNKIDDAICDPAFGLQEIKRQVKDNEKKLDKIDDIVSNPSFGLQEVKRQVKENEKKLDQIKDTVNDENFGLQEIKRQIKEIERMLKKPEAKTDTLTTGPLFVNFTGANNGVIQLRAQNYTDRQQSVTFTVHKLDNNCPFTNDQTKVTLDLEPLCAGLAEVPLNNDIQSLEILAQLSCDSDLLVYAAILETGDSAELSLKKDILHSEWTVLKNNYYFSSEAAVTDHT